MTKNDLIVASELIYPSEAVLAVAEKYLFERQTASGQPAEATGLYCYSSAIEAPSAILAADLALREYDQLLVVQVDSVQKPDPRLARVPVDFQLWRYRGLETRATPNIEEPPGDITTLVADIAQRDSYSPIDLTTTARKLGVDAKRALLGVMVYPPEKPEAFSEVRWWHWLYRVQIAAAMVLSQIDEGWKDSARRRILFSLANGPMDWSVNAAILALTAAALEDAAIEQEVRRLFNDLLRVGYPLGHMCCYTCTLIQCLYALPATSFEERADLEQKMQWLLPRTA